MTMKKGDKVKVNKLGALSSIFKEGQEVVFTGDYASIGLWMDFEGLDVALDKKIRQYLAHDQFNVLASVD